VQARLKTQVSGHRYARLVTFRLPDYARSQRVLRAVVAVALIAGYAVTFPLLTPFLGPSVAVVGFAAVMVCAWLWGTTIGVLAGVAVSIANAVLYAVVLHMQSTLANAGVPLLVAVGLGALVGYLRDLRHKLAEQNAAIQRQADRDPLTSLLNRASLGRELERLVELSDSQTDVMCVLFIDLDRFKVVNDTLGHNVGDRVLQSVADRLAEHTRRGDLVGRLGGDEFVVVLKDIGHAGDAMAVARHVLSALSQPHDVCDDPVSVHASIGISLFPRDGRTFEELVGRADKAMYRVKWQGKNGVRFFGEDGREEASRMQLYRDLGAALGRGDLRLVYQPIVDLSSARVVKLEALVRWTHPELGPVAPTTVVALAEELGLTATLGRWVFESACRDAAAWPAVNGERPSVSVNVAPGHVIQAAFADHVLAALDSAGLSASRIELELTEEALLGQREEAVEGLARLRGHGVRIAIDDFGTGYSSLAYLRELPADTLKLDRVFIEALDTAPTQSAYNVVDAVVSLGHALGKTVVAEGVETHGQLDSVRHIGCDQAQGFFVARPAPLEALALDEIGQMIADSVSEAAIDEARILRLGS
jgi:diguanylate cyclase